MFRLSDGMKNVLFLFLIFGFTNRSLCKTETDDASTTTAPPPRGRSLYLLGAIYRKFRQRWMQYTEPGPLYAGAAFPSFGYYNCPTFGCNPALSYHPPPYEPANYYYGPTHPYGLNLQNAHQQQQQQQHQQSNVYIYQTGLGPQHRYPAVARPPPHPTGAYGTPYGPSGYAPGPAGPISNQHYPPNDYGNYPNGVAPVPLAPLAPLGPTPCSSQLYPCVFAGRGM